MKRTFALLCLLSCFIGCGSRQGGSVIDNSNNKMTLEELQAMQAASLAAEKRASAAEDGEES